MGVGGEHVHVFGGSRESAQCLNGIQAEEDVAFAERAADGLIINSIAADEMAGGESDQTCVFVHLVENIFRANHSEAARINHSYFRALRREGCPGIDIRWVII